MISTEALTVPVSATSPVVIQNRMPLGYPWGMPEKFMIEGYNQHPQVDPLAPAAASPAPPMVHVIPIARNGTHYTTPPSVNMVLLSNDEVYNPIPPPSESLGFYDPMDNFQDQFDKMQKELKSLRGKELFRQNVNDM